MEPMTSRVCGPTILNGPWAQFWTHSSPSRAVHQWSPGLCSRGSRTVADAGERHATLLESVLGATPQEFESPILRHADVQEHPMMAAGMRGYRGCVVSLMVSVLGADRCHRRDKPLLLCLVTGALYRPERRGACRRSVRPTVQGWPRPSGYPPTCRSHHPE